jgi:FkbM family methyltransferase
MLRSFKRRLGEFMRYQAERGSQAPEVLARLDALNASIGTFKTPAAADAPASPSGSESFSQLGEDRIVASILRFIGQAEPLRYADIGAAHPVWDNNTYLFYKAGGSGLLVEADPDYLAEYSQHRPRDAVEQVAVVPERLAGNGNITFYAMEDRGWSSISAEHSALAASLGKGGVRREFTVRCEGINALLSRHFPEGRIDLLSIDIEGVDAELLADLDMARFSPKILIVENDGAVEETDGVDRAGSPFIATARMMKARGYRFYGYTFVNTIYVRADVLEAARF